MADGRGLARRLPDPVRSADGSGSLVWPAAGAYTEFKTQVANKNVGELFARGNSIEGQLKKAAPLPGQPDRSYQQFTTERPTFANDDLLRELTARRRQRRATPLVQQRGFVTNLLISFAPILLLVAFYVWMFKRQQGAWRRPVGRRQAEARRPRDGPRHV